MRPHAVTQVVTDTVTKTFGYDAVGNMITRNIGGTVYNLTYDAENRLTKVTGGATADFYYDGDGNRVKATVGGVTTRYVGDYYEYEVGTATVRKYYTHWGKRIALREGGTLYWLLTDHLGSTAIVTGTTASEVRYDAWGADRYTSGSLHTTYRFTGERWESGIKLYRMGARWYDPEIGRWVSGDSIVPEPGNPQALNRYSYAYNNAQRYVDPSGHAADVNVGAGYWQEPEEPEYPSFGEYGELESLLAADNIALSWLLGLGQGQWEFNSSQSITQDIAWDAQMDWAHTQWANAGYSPAFKCNPTIDVRGAEYELASFLAYVREHVQFVQAHQRVIEGRHLSEPATAESQIDALGATIGSLDEVHFYDAGHGMVRIEVFNTANWLSAGRKFASNDSYLSRLRPPEEGLGPFHWGRTYSQHFVWYEPHPRGDR